MARPLPFILLIVCLIQALPVTWAQTSHRGPAPRTQSTPDVFDTLDKQQESDRRAELAKSAAARKQRQVQVADLAKDLLRLKTLTQALQERLHSTDLQNSLPADLRKQSAELEHLARDINKKVRGL